MGITGGIGSGKSTVARLIRTMGYPVYDSDQRARYLQTHDQSLICAMADLLGEDILENGEIDRAKVAERVFDNEQLLDQLNALVHPRVKADFEDWLAQQNSPLIFKESALLVETGAHKECEAVIFVAAPEQTRMERVILRDEVTEAQVRARMKRQLSDEEKQAACSHTVINNDEQLLIPQVEQLIENLMKLDEKPS